MTKEHPPYYEVSACAESSVITFWFKYFEQGSGMNVAQALLYREMSGALVLQRGGGVIGTPLSIMDAIKIIENGTSLNGAFVKIDFDESIFVGSKTTFEKITEGIPATSMFDTMEHIYTVTKALHNVGDLIKTRGPSHDASKISDAERPIFDEYTPKLATVTYGSDKYREFLKGMKPALDNHYAANRHHPEHFPNGVAGMNLVDVVEMACDWYAASQRHNDGDPVKSCDLNAERFGLPPMLVSILKNTMTLLAEQEGRK